MLRWRDDLVTACGVEPRVAGRKSLDDQQRFAFALHDLVEDLDLGHELGAAAERRKSRAPSMTVAGRAGPDEPPVPRTPRCQETGERHAGAGRAGTGRGRRRGFAARARATTADRKPETESVGRPHAARTRCTTIRINPNRHYRVFTRAHDQVVEARGAVQRRRIARNCAAISIANRAHCSRPWRASPSGSNACCWRSRRGAGNSTWRRACSMRRVSRASSPTRWRRWRFARKPRPTSRTPWSACCSTTPGSMRGRPIMVAALCADVLARTLERCGVKVEILGFTTREWSGGHSREDWLQAGRPAAPGRLTDLRYIVYKPADVPYRRAQTPPRRDAARKTCSRTTSTARHCSGRTSGCCAATSNADPHGAFPTACRSARPRCRPTRVDISSSTCATS